MEVKVNAVPIVDNGHKYLRIKSPVRVNHRVAGGTVWAEVKAVWDTGATNTSIPMDLAVAMGIPLGEPSTVTRMKSTEPARFCQFYLEFPDGTEIFVEEALALPKMKPQFIIGMDVIRKGVTTIEPDGEDGVRFTFRM